MNTYIERGLRERTGTPGTAEWIKGYREDIFWIIRQTFLALGSLSEYKRLYDLDKALAEEQRALEQIIETHQDEAKQQDLSRYNNAKRYFQQGQKNIKEANSHR